MTQSWRSDAAGLDSAGLIDANGSRNDTLPLSVNDRAFIKLAAIRVWLRAYELRWVRELARWPVGQGVARPKA